MIVCANKTAYHVMPMRSVKLIAFILYLCIFITPISSFNTNAMNYRYNNVFIYIDNYGIAHINMKIVSNTTGIAEVFLPITPVVPSINALVDDKNTPVVICSDAMDVVCIPIEKSSSTIVLSYIANVSLDQGIFWFIIKPPSNVTLTISPNIILLGLPSTIIGRPIVHGENLTIKFIVIEPYTLRYTVRETTTTPQATVTSVRGTLFEGPMVIILIIAICIVAVAFSLYILVRRGYVLGRGVAKEFGDIDIMIIKSLEKRGGSALQSELQKDIPIPKTTLWRHVKKLEKMGIVKIEKVGIQNRVILTRKPRL